MKQHQQSTVFTLLELKKSQREIHRITGIDRKTIRRYMAILRHAHPRPQIPPPPRPSARRTLTKLLHSRDHRLFRPRWRRLATSISPVLCASPFGNGSKNKFACNETLRLSTRISLTNTRLPRATRASNGSCVPCAISIRNNSTVLNFCRASNRKLAIIRLMGSASL